MEIKIQNILNTKSLPQDELDDFWDNLFGFLPLFMFLIITKDNVIFFIINIAFILYAFFLKITEKKLKTIETYLTKEENNILVEKIAEIENWKVKTITNGYYEYYIPLIFGKPGHKLTIISIENKLFLNLRNIGTSKGRASYLFGIDTYKERKIINLLRDN